MGGSFERIESHEFLGFEREVVLKMKKMRQILGLKEKGCSVKGVWLIYINVINASFIVFVPK